jgi:urease subunit alpha
LYAFVSKAAANNDIKEQIGLEKGVEGVGECRDLTKKDMVLNDATPSTQVNPETFEVRADSQL